MSTYFIYYAPLLQAADPGDCSLNKTLDNITLTGSATVDINATLTATLANATLTGLTAVDIDATLAATLVNVTLTGTTSVDINATLTATLGNITLTGAVTVDISCDLNATLANITGAATITVDIEATLNALMGSVTLDSDATNVDPPQEPFLDIILDDITLNACIDFFEGTNLGSGVLVSSDVDPVVSLLLTDMGTGALVITDKGIGVFVGSDKTSNNLINFVDRSCC